MNSGTVFVLRAADVMASVKSKKMLANVGICPALSSCNNTQDICRHISKTVYNKNISTKQYFSYRKNSKEKTDFIVKIWAHPRQVTGQFFAWESYRVLLCRAHKK